MSDNWQMALDTLTVRILLYNLVMAGVDAAAVALLWRRPTAAVACIGVGYTGIMAAGVAALATWEVNQFAAIMLAAYGLFLHMLAMLAIAGALLWTTRRKAAIGFIAVAMLLATVAADAFLIEPAWLEVSHVRIVSSKITAPLRIVVLADLQTDSVGPYEQDVFRRALEEKPDLLLLAGDYIQVSEDKRDELFDRLNRVLRELSWPGPERVFAVRGNCDRPGWERMFGDLPITTVNAPESFQTAGIQLTCLSMEASSNSSLRVAAPDSRRFHIVLGHLPNFALGRIDADLLIAGHTHGGQVRLPLVGPIMTLSKIPRSWAAGVTDLTGGRKLVVSRGVGMERTQAPRLRFLCRPELVVIDLVPEGKEFVDNVE